MTDFDRLTDEQIVFLVLHRDKELFRLLVERYEKRLLRYVQYYYRKREICEEIVQETFIKVYVNLQHFNPTLKFSSWIYRITHNEAINELKKYAHEVSLDDNSEWIRELADKSETVEFELQQEEKIELIKKCLERMPKKYKSVLVLYFGEEKSYQEISDILEIPLGTVGTLISRGKKVMKRLYLQMQKEASLNP